MLLTFSLQSGSRTMPRSIRQMTKRPDEELSQPTSTRQRTIPLPPPVSGARPPAQQEWSTSGGKSLRGFIPSSQTGETETEEPEAPSGRVLAVASGSNAAGGGSTPQPQAQETSCWPDLQNYANRMVRTLTRSEREAVPGVGQVNIDRVQSLLAEVCTG
ncbi:uncharacterized protein LOC110729815 [Chenopodium quinoa]|uniref:uncharacterized protein LOC110729814 n=1 Tax=Chenopodium quinoa TaxID=63459 RepID=UPI000B791C65|nr:uncharacterized protein LOC110729814 [Chenopodium quinoa]XP_021765283.1 uncharacterized protein LOC110729815 [Chenopodium quinoa]